MVWRSGGRGCSGWSGVGVLDGRAGSEDSGRFVRADTRGGLHRGRKPERRLQVNQGEPVNPADQGNHTDPPCPADQGNLANHPDPALT